MRTGVPIFAVLFLQFTTLVGVCRADIEVEFPAELVGGLYWASPEKVHFGNDSSIDRYVPEWEFLADATGKVQLPKGKLIRLTIQRLPKNGKSDLDTSWVQKIPKDAIQSLIIRAPLKDQQFADFAYWTALQELQLRDCEVTSAIAPELAKLTQLKSLGFSRMPSIDDELMTAVASLPDLKVFSLFRGKVTDKGMAHLSCSRSLMSARVYGVAITDEGIASLAKLPKLLSLDVYAAESYNPEILSEEGVQTKVTDVGLKHIGGCPQLQSLNIHGADVTLAGLQRLFQRCPDLRYLALSRSAVDLGGLEAASVLSHLETIRVTGTELNDQDAKQLSQLKNLREIIGSFHISNEGVEQLGSLQHLETLALSGKANDRCMPAIARLGNLKKLSIQSTKITDDGLELLKGMTKLEDVTLTQAGFTSRCLQTVATWPNLHRLTLWNLNPRQDGKAEWSEISLLPSKVRFLDLVDCPKIGDLQLRAIGSLANLESLSIQSRVLQRITDTGASYLARAPKLRSLTIRPSFITDQGLSSLQAIEALENLDIECVATSVGLENLGQHKRLKSLVISSPDLSRMDGVGYQSRHPQFRQFWLDECHYSRAQSDGKPVSIADSILRRGSLEERKQLNALEGKAPPPFNATAWTPTVSEVSLEKLRGKVVLIEFWGTWCGACLKDLPRVRELYSKYGEQGLEVITIHSTSEAENMAGYLARDPFPWINGCDVNEHTANAYAVDSWPSRYLIDKQGMVRIANPLDEQLEQAIKLLIDE